MAFRRRKSDGESEQPAGGSDDRPDGPDTAGSDAAADAATEAATEAEAPGDRSAGPWDSSEVDEPGERIDLGALLVRGRPGLTLQAQVDEKTQRVTLITIVLGEGAVQVQPFAAPRTSGIWGDVRRTLMSSITGSGGLVEEAEGRFGTELRAQVPGQGGGLQPARFVGVDGPRWFLRGLFLGAAADPARATDLEDVFADVIVVRGQEAMAPGEPLALTLPAGGGAAGSEDSAGEPGQPDEPAAEGPVES